MHIFIFISLCTKPGCEYLYSSDKVGEILANKGTIMLSFSTGLGVVHSAACSESFSYIIILLVTARQ